MMEIRCEKLDISSDDQLKAIIKWESDKEINYLIRPVFSAEDNELNQTFESLKERTEKKPENYSDIYMIFDQKKLIGNFSLQIDPPQVMKKEKGTSWLGLTIGEKEYWGTGAASEAMTLFEQESLRLGAKRIELGTFEFNQRAYHFYKKIGYVEIGQIPDFTFWKGRFWKDIRMEKYLAKSKSIYNA